MRYDNKNTIGVLLGIAGIAYGVYSQSKMNKLAKKLNQTIDDLGDKTSIEVSKDSVDAAIDQAVEREVSIVAHKAAIATSVEISSSIRKEVKQTVDSEFSNLSSKVSDEISTQVANIDKDALTSKVTKKAEQKILSQKREIHEGNREWELLISKYFTEELDKLDKV